MPALTKPIQKPEDTDDNSLRFKEAGRRLKEHSQNGQPAHLRLVEIGIEIEVSADAGRTLAEVLADGEGKRSHDYAHESGDDDAAGGGFAVCFAALSH